MSLGRSSRFCFFGLAKVKSKKVLSSFASALSITIRHGSMTLLEKRLVVARVKWLLAARVPAY